MTTLTQLLSATAAVMTAVPPLVRAIRGLRRPPPVKTGQTDEDTANT